MARTIVGVVLGLGFLAALVVTTLRETRVECEVCLEYAGRSECRTASGGDAEQARMQALTSVCTVLASGVTRGLECQRTPPRSVRCTP